MIPTAKFICPICKKEVYINQYNLKREPFRRRDYYSFYCDKCKSKLTITTEEFEVFRVDG